MSNPGANPIPATDLGRLRLELGDTQHKPLVPAVPGMADYAYFSDAELTAILDGSTDGSSVNWSRAKANGFRKLAVTLTLLAKNITSDDLRIMTEQRAEIMRKIAADYAAEADSADAIGAHDSFEIVPTGAGNSIGREYAHGQWF